MIYGIEVIYFCEKCKRGCCLRCIDDVTNICTLCKKTQSESVMKCTVSAQMYHMRLQRMKKLIECGAPPILIYMEACLIIKACHPNWWYRLKSWLAATRFGLWTDPEWIRFKLTGNSPIYSEISNLAKMRDEDIDTSDIPEVTDWSKAEVGKFYRPQAQSCCSCLNPDTRRLGCGCPCHN